MLITFDLYELKKMCADMAALGVATARRDDSPAKDLISQREAYERFQEQRVKRWLKQGLLTTQRNGATKNSTRYYSVAELMALSNAESLDILIRTSQHKYLQQ